MEFKKKANHPEKIVRELVAFANTTGGILLLGIDDDGTVSGSRDMDGEVYVLEEAIQDLIRPKIQYSIEVIKLNEKKGIAVFEIGESKKKPHFASTEKNSKAGKAYVRAADQSIQASREVREIIRRRLRPKDIQFSYGEKEKVLLEYLDIHDYITVNKFKSEAKVNRYIASKTLIRLTLANVLDVVPKEVEDRFILTRTM